MSNDREARLAFEPSVRRGPDSMREFRLGPLLILAGLARDPNDRLWGITDPSGMTRTRHLVSLHYLEVPDGRRVWGVYLGPLCLYWRWGA
jgi:hypothetical protein